MQHKFVPRHCSEEEGKQILSDGIYRMLNRGIVLIHKRNKKPYTIIDLRCEIIDGKRVLTDVLRSDDGDIIKVNTRKELAFRFEAPEIYRDPLLWLGEGI